MRSVCSRLKYRQQRSGNIAVKEGGERGISEWLSLTFAIRLFTERFRGMVAGFSRLILV
jgi:hypothetical protein